MTAGNVNQRTIRAASPADGDAIARIYNHYVANTVVSFEEEEVVPTEMVKRIALIQNASLPWLVAEVEGVVVGYAYAGKWSARSAYRHSVEVTIYLATDHTRQGLGSSLYALLFPMLRDRGIHTIIAGITLPNEASVGLHEKVGLRNVGIFKEVGHKFGRWLDVGYWQRAL